MFRRVQLADTSESEYNAPELLTFKGSLSNLVSGVQMFADNGDLDTFSSNLNSLVNGERMFENCSSLYNFSLISESVPTQQTSQVTLDRVSYFNNLVNGKEMFSSCGTLNGIDSDFPSLKYADGMFRYCGNLRNIGDFYGIKTADEMFRNCIWLSLELTKPFNSLISANNMFEGCYRISSFTSSLPELQYADGMFSGCYYISEDGATQQGLSTFESNIPNLISANNMFEDCKLITSFISEISSLKDANNMFLNCVALEQFIGSTFDLENADNMFSGCTSLSSFTGELESLIHAEGMFSGCILDSDSLECILDTIGTSYQKNGVITIGLGCAESDKDVFAQKIGYNSMGEIITHLTQKKWNPVIEYNG